MGQNYIIVSLDKREFISPGAFNHGSKLIEFTSAGNGIMQALAVLTACGNGLGSGDIAVQQTDNLSAGQKEHGEFRYGTAVVPRISGRWTGDRIVTAGEYSSGRMHVDPAEDPTHTGNLYRHAWSKFTNISTVVLDQLGAFGAGTAGIDVEYMIRVVLSTKLFEEYPRLTRVVSARAEPRCVWDMSWLDWASFDRLLLDQPTPKALANLKAWLRKQYLLDWQRELLKYYRCNTRPQADRLPQLLRNAGIDTENIWPKGKNLQRILPRKVYLDAALQVEQADDAANVRLAKDRTDAEWAKVFKSALSTEKPETRESRVIDLD